MYEDKLIGEKLKQLRKKSGYTMETVANKYGLTKGTISLYESGKRTISTPMFLELLDLYDADQGEVVKQIVYEHNRKPKVKKLTTNEIIGIKLKNLREKHNYSIEEFADVINVSSNVYSKFEQGKKSIYAIDIRTLLEFIDEDEGKFYNEVIEESLM